MQLNRRKLFLLFGAGCSLTSVKVRELQLSSRSRVTTPVTFGIDKGFTS
jgi:hypothetical protein